MMKAKVINGWILGFIFVLAIILRVIAFSYRNAFEDDECRLLSVILDKSWLQMFFNLGEAQSAPPLFIILERLWGCIWGFKEHSLKLISLGASLVSIYFFYKLSLKILTNSVVIIIANLLFAINIKLITFSSIIKQYSADVLVGLICCLVLPQIDITKLSKRKLLLCIFGLILLPLISLPSFFFIGLFFLLKLIQNFKNKSFYLRFLWIILPFITVMGVYYIFNLAPSKLSMDEWFPHYWDTGLVGFSFTNFMQAIIQQVEYLFQPNKYSWAILILLSIGIYFLIKEKRAVSSYILAVLGFAIFASILKLYPLAGRVALYLTPLLILICIKPFEMIYFKKPVFYCLLTCFILAFGKYFSGYTKTLFLPETYINYSPKILMQILKTEFNPKTDVVVCNSASSSSYIFYSSFYQFKNDEVYELPLYGEPYQEDLETLNNLKSGQKYWFYLIKDYDTYNSFPLILDWAKSQSILKHYKDRNSHLILIQKL